jgi:diguanylate cyclase (GGDEF)-like protein/PAS domain S-box-containing protein
LPTTSPQPEVTAWSEADLLAVAVIIAAADGSAGFANRAWTAMTGQQEPDWMGQGWFAVLDEACRHTERAALLTAIRRGSPHETDWTVTRDGLGDRVLHVVAVPNLKGGLTVGFVVTVSDVTDERERHTRLSYLATHDPLTGLYNRVPFAEFVGHALDRLRRHPERLAAVLFIDVDGLKATNDRFGHDAGDRLLQSVAHRLSGAVRNSDIVARYGGDEFTVLCEDLRDADEATTILDRIGQAATATAGGDEVVGLSIGIAMIDDPDVDATAIITRADRAMYQAKRARHGLGRSRSRLPS